MYRVLLLALQLTAAASHKCSRTGSLSGDNINTLTRCKNVLTNCDSESETDCDLNRRLGKWDCMERCGKCITTVRTGTMIRPDPKDAHQLQVTCGLKAYCGPETKISTYVLSMYVKKPGNPGKNKSWADEDCIAHVGSEIKGGSICDQHKPISTKYQDDWKIVEDNQGKTIQDARLILTLRKPSADVGTVFRCEFIIRHSDRELHDERYEEKLQLSQVPTVTTAPSKPSTKRPSSSQTNGDGGATATTTEPRTTTEQMPTRLIIILNVVGWSVLSLIAAWIWYSRCYNKPRPGTKRKAKRKQPSSETTESTESTESS